MTKTFNVEGMMCNHCADRLTKVLTNINGISEVKVSLENKNCTVTFENITENEITSAITDAGFEVK